MEVRISSHHYSYVLTRELKKNDDINISYFFQLPYSHLIDPDRQESVTVAIAAATAAVMASSAMEVTRLEGEKLRVHAKDKKEQSNILVYFYVSEDNSMTYFVLIFFRCECLG
jgi:hypothetical protein